MALTAVVATAVAIAAVAAADGGLNSWLVCLGLTLVVARLVVDPRRAPSVRLPPGREARILGWATGAGALAVYLLAWHETAEGRASIASLALFAATAASLLWPAPVVQRYCLLLAAATLALNPFTAGDVPFVALFAAATAVALVTLNRQSLGAPDRPRRMAGEASALFVIAALAGLLAATLLPDPPGGGGPRFGGRGERGDKELAPYLHYTDVLDAGGPGSGDGNEILFRVKAAESALWRTLTFDEYDGRLWLRSDEFLPPEGDATARSVTIPPGIGDGSPTSGGLEQRVKVETSYIGVLPAAARPYRVTLPEGTGAATAADAAVFAIPLLSEGDTYTVTSDLGPSAAQQAPLDVTRAYLAFPALPTRVRDLAAELTANAPTPAAKAGALRDWFVANTVVKTGTRPLADDVDPIDQYLFVERAGSSEQAASAMAIMLRAVGVPARLAVGYRPGQQSALDGEFVVRARHAAAWVEAWLPGVGWTSFDPSGRFLGPEPAADSLLDRLKRLLARYWWVLALLVLAVAGWVVSILLRRRRARLARPWATRCYERVTRAGHRHGRPRRPAETPAEYCAALAGDVPEERLAEVGRLITTAAYSRREPPPADQAWAEGVVATLERTAPPRRTRARGKRPTSG